MSKQTYYTTIDYSRYMTDEKFDVEKFEAEVRNPQKDFCFYGSFIDAFLAVNIHGRVSSPGALPYVAVYPFVTTIAIVKCQLDSKDLEEQAISEYSRVETTKKHMTSEIARFFKAEKKSKTDFAKKLAEGSRIAEINKYDKYNKEHVFPRERPYRLLVIKAQSFEIEWIKKVDTSQEYIVEEKIISADILYQAPVREQKQVALLAHSAPTDTTPFFLQHAYGTNPPPTREQMEMSELPLPRSGWCRCWL